MVQKWITITQAAKLVGKDRSTIQRRISYKQNSWNSKLLIDVDCFKVGRSWIIKKERILEIYKTG